MSALMLGFEQSYQGLLRFLTRKLGCGETARELAHEAWLRVAEAGPDRLGGAPEQRRAYLYTVAQNLALDHLRRQARGGQRFEAGLEAALLQDLSPSGAPDQERALALRQAVQGIEGALGGLPERVRETFLAHRLDGLDHETLAQRHGVSVKTVERDVGQAMDAVHQALLRWRGERPAPRRRRQALSALLGVGGCALIGSLVGRRRELGDGELLSAAGPVLAEQRLVSRRGQLLEQRLPDGSRLHLDADSELQWRWHKGLRQARLLRGAAFFAVQPDAERPFVVQAGACSVRVLGTAFAVDYDGRRVSVAVEHGRVRVSDAQGRRRELVGGQRLRWDAESGLAGAELEAVAHDAVAPWRSGWLVFDAAPLAEVLPQLARYLSRPLVWTPAAGRQRVSARVHLAHVQEWLRLLPTSHELVLQQQAAAWRLSMRGE